LLITGFLILCFVWGTSWVAIKYSLEAYPPFLGAALRFVAAGVALLVYARVRRISLRSPDGSWKIIFATSLMVYLLNYGLIYWAEYHLSAGITAVVFSTFPLFTGLFSHFVFRLEPFRLNVYGGLILAFGGILFIFREDWILSEFSARLLLPAAAVLISSISAAISSLIVKKYLHRIHPVTSTFQQLLFGTTGLFVLSFLFRERPGELSHLSSTLAVLYLGLVASAFAFALYYWLLQQMSAVTVSLLVYFNPCVAIFFGWLMLGEKLPDGAFFGIALIFGGVLLSQIHAYSSLLRKRRQGL